jgi:hypothetical protein
MKPGLHSHVAPQRPVREPEAECGVGVGTAVGSQQLRHLGRVAQVARDLRGAVPACAQGVQASLTQLLHHCATGSGALEALAEARVAAHRGRRGNRLRQLCPPSRAAGAVCVGEHSFVGARGDVPELHPEALSVVEGSADDRARVPAFEPVHPPRYDRRMAEVGGHRHTGHQPTLEAVAAGHLVGVDSVFGLRDLVVGLGLPGLRGRHEATLARNPLWSYPVSVGSRALRRSRLRLSPERPV